MKNVKTIAVCAVVALGVGATSATAGSLITGAKIKNGTVAMRDLTPGVQKMIKERPINGTNGTTGATGANGKNGTNGQNGVNGTNGAAGSNGKDGVRYDRIVGSCDSGPTGEVSIADGIATLGTPTQNAWAQIKSYPTSLKVSDLDELTYTAASTDIGQSYLKIATTGHGSIVFDPSSQEAGDQSEAAMTTYDVMAGTARFNDDVGAHGQSNWTGPDSIMEALGDRHIKSIAMTSGCALGNGGETLVDDLTINDEVIDFN